jgi:hypothetical protein
MANVVNSQTSSLFVSVVTENFISKNLVALAQKVAQAVRYTVDVFIIQFKPKEDKAFYYLINHRFDEVKSSNEEYAVHDLLKSIREGDFDSFSYILRDCKANYPQNYYAICIACLEFTKYLPDSAVKSNMVDKLNKEISKIPLKNRTAFSPTIEDDKGSKPYSSTMKKVFGFGFLFLMFLSPAAYFLSQNKQSSSDQSAIREALELECANGDNPVCRAVQSQQCPTLDSYVQQREGRVALGEFRTLYGEERDLSNRGTRDLYHRILGTIPSLHFNSSSDCMENARVVSGIRTTARIYCRERGSFLSHVFAQFRDVWVYGNRNGPTFEDSQRKYSRGGTVSPEDVCASIISGAQKSNKFYDGYVEQQT